MSYKEKATKSTELEKDNKYFDKLVTLLLLIGIIVISGFLLYSILNPEPGDVSFGILNSEKEAGNYPTSVELGNNISFFLTVNNYFNREFSFRIELLISNDTVITLPSNRLYARSILNTSTLTLHRYSNWVSNRFDVSFTEPGDNQTIIAELWEINDDFPGKFFTSLYLRLNVTI